MVATATSIGAAFAGPSLSVVLASPSWSAPDSRSADVGFGSAASMRTEPGVASTCSSRRIRGPYSSRPPPWRWVMASAPYSGRSAGWTVIPSRRLHHTCTAASLSDAAKPERWQRDCMKIDGQRTFMASLACLRSANTWCSSRRSRTLRSPLRLTSSAGSGFRAAPTQPT
jgi:hypothetical protein